MHRDKFSGLRLARWKQTDQMDTFQFNVEGNHLAFTLKRFWKNRPFAEWPVTTAFLEQNRTEVA